MKKIYFIIIFFSFVFGASAQTKPEDTGFALKSVENSKSGNFKDVITGLYQAAFKNVSQNEKSLEFNSTLFALVEKSDKDILKTMERSNIFFLRNFQISGKTNFNENFKFSGYSAGITWSLINGRDKEFINLTGTEYHYDSDQFDSLVRVAVSLVRPEITGKLKGAELKEANHKITSIRGEMLSGDFDNADDMEYYDIIIPKLDSLVLLSDFPKMVNDEKNPLNSGRLVGEYLKNKLNKYYSDLEKKALLTLTADGGANTKNKFDRANIGLVYLKGSNNGELDLRAKFAYADTTALNMPRTAFNAKAGWNFKILKNKADNKSVFELKFYGEYNKIFRNALPDEEENNILADADIRLRITDELWLPFTIKYDTKNSNFLGFLNVTYNFGDD